MKKWILATLMMLAAPAFSADANRDYLLQLADAAGEYFAYDRTEYVDDVIEISIGSVPQDVLATAQAILNDRIADIQTAYDASSNSQFGEVQYAILKNGYIVGYVINFEDYINDSLWDGSGAHAYILVKGLEVVTVVNFSS
jgi:hypothetical protein